MHGDDVGHGLGWGKGGEAIDQAYQWLKEAMRKARVSDGVRRNEKVVRPGGIWTRINLRDVVVIKEQGRCSL